MKFDDDFELYDFDGEDYLKSVILRDGVIYQSEDRETPQWFNKSININTNILYKFKCKRCNRKIYTNDSTYLCTPCKSTIDNEIIKYNQEKQERLEKNKRESERRQQIVREQKQIVREQKIINKRIKPRCLCCQCHILPIENYYFCDFRCEITYAFHRDPANYKKTADEKNADLKSHIENAIRMARSVGLSEFATGAMVLEKINQMVE